ncbi:MAG: Flp pilus assembly complex ATPase component TadA [Candidatus Omnitrophica bacterium]|nr:Flp pilus assembly complex ATPase component TadA [Candidatus Omnitrophota bacterium]
MDINNFLKDSLLEQNLVATDKLEKAEQMVSTEKSLVDILYEQQIVEEDVLLDILTKYSGIVGVNLHFYTPDAEVVELMTMNLCQKYQVFPLFKIKNTLMMATANPSDVHAMDEIRVKTGYGVEPILALRRAIDDAINKAYGVKDSVSDVIETIEDEEAANKLDAPAELIEAASDEPIVKLVNLFISHAIRDRASDIHINPEEEILRVRYRIDGALQEVAQPAKRLQPAIISRLKILANLDIAERRMPQDGRIDMKIDNQPVDIRLSTFPTVHGENIVMRILKKGSVLMGLEDLGLSKKGLEQFSVWIKRPYGIILTSGPTGSGKTTTLYAALGRINSVDRNIMTLEDPVEYQMPLIRQSQINTRTGFTFPHGLRCVMRQDPDIILVGEIRDLETANIAVQAGMTGHLVFTTLHTNDAPACISRFTEMGVEHFLVASTLVGAIAQRLVRVICPDCKEEYTPSKEIIEELRLFHTDMKYYRGKGCQQCRNTGYHGRIAIFELMEVSARLQEAITHKETHLEIRKIALKEGMLSLRDDGVDKIKAGITTPDEVIKATKYL